MSFGKFLRRLSFDSENVAEQSSGETTGVNSLFAAPSKLLDTVNSKTGNLVSDLNQKLDIGGKLDSLKHVSVSKFGSVKQTEATPNIVPKQTTTEARILEPATKKESENMSASTRVDETDQPVSSLRRQSTNTAPRPPRPPPPTAAALNRAMSLDESNLSFHSSKKQHTSKRSALVSQLEAAKEIEEEEGRSSQIIRGSISVEEEGESSASEYGAHGDQPVYEGDMEPGKPGSVIKPKHSREASPDLDLTEISSERVRNMMEECVPALLRARWKEVDHYETDLQDALGTSPGRIEFVSKFEQEAKEDQGAIESEALPPLLEKITYFLNECQDAEDFGPARKLLTTSLLYYVSDPSMPGDRTFLFSYIKSSPIWQSLRFWNACFFQSVQEAKAKLADRPGKTSEEIVYEQLSSYLNTMNVFDLHETIKHEFLRKHSSLFNLSDEEVRTLRAIIEQSS